MKKEILGVMFDDLTREEAVQAGAKLLEEDKFHYVVTPNPEFILAAEKDSAFRQVLNEADLVLADGIGVVYSAKIQGTPLKGRVTGIGFAEDMLAALQERGGRLYLLGAKPGVAETAAERLRERYPGLRIAGFHDGYFQEDGPIVENIRQSGADTVFVCLGAPKQELWMAKNGLATGARLLCGLGGSIDVFAGTVKRAPKFWCDHGLEWFYRLCSNPRRLGRMMKLPVFLVHVRRAGRRK